MNFLILILCFYDWFYNEYTQTLVEEARCRRYFNGETRIDTLQNPFYQFFKAMEFDRKGLFIESIKRLERALEISDDKIAYLIRFYIVSLDKDLKSFEEEIKRKLIYLREKNEWDGIYFLSAYLLLRSKSAIDNKVKEFLLRESILFSPDFYPSYVELIKLHVENLKLFKAIGDFSRFLGLLFNNTFLRGFVILIFLKIFFIIFYYFIIFFSLGKIIHYAGYETTYFKKFMRTPFPFLLTLGIIFILLSIPSPYHLLLLLPIFIFFKRKERFLFYLLSIITISIFYFGALEGKIEGYYSPKSYEVMLLRIKNILFSKKVFNTLKEDNLFEANIKGVMLAKDGRVDSAFDYFRKISKKYPDEPSILLNIGNLFYLKGKYDSAYVYYKKSLEINPEYLEAHFNIAQIGFKRFDLSLYEKEIEKAQEINYSAVTKKTLRIKEYDAEEMFWGVAPPPEIKQSRKSRIWELYGFPLSGIFVIFLFIGSILLFKKKGEASHCGICGKLANELFKIEPGFEACRICATEILKTESIKIRERIADRLKVNAIERKKFITFLLNLVFPPLGFIYAGSHFFFALAFVFLFIGFYLGISLKIHLLWIGFYLIYIIVFVFPFYYFKEVKIGTSG